MAETKDKIVTVESLSSLHEYNKITYMPKAIDLGNTPFQYNPADFTSFIVEIAGVEDVENETRHIIFTDKISNALTLDTKAQAFHFDSDGNIQLYELSFYWGDGGYMVDATLSSFASGEKVSEAFAYTKIYGIKYL